MVRSARKENVVTVYIVIGFITQYNGADAKENLAVFDTRRKAEREVERRKRFQSFDYYQIEEHEVK